MICMYVYIYTSYGHTYIYMIYIYDIYIYIGLLEDAGFCVMGFAGRKGKDRHLIGSNVLEVMRSGRCSTIVFKEAGGC